METKNNTSCITACHVIAGASPVSFHRLRLALRNQTPVALHFQQHPFLPVLQLLSDYQGYPHTGCGQQTLPTELCLEGSGQGEGSPALF